MMTTHINKMRRMEDILKGLNCQTLFAGCWPIIYYACQILQIDLPEFHFLRIILEIESIFCFSFEEANQQIKQLITTNLQDQISFLNQSCFMLYLPILNKWLKQRVFQSYHFTIKPQLLYSVSNYKIYSKEIIKMSRFQTSERRESISKAIISDFSSDISLKNNKERIREFKNLSLKGNSVMEHIFSHGRPKNLKAQSSTLFYSQKWDFAAVQQKNQRESLKGSSNNDTDNPFYRANLNHLNMQKTSVNSLGSQKFMDDPAIEFQLVNEKTTSKKVAQIKFKTDSKVNSYEIKEQIRQYDLFACFKFIFRRQRDGLDRKIKHYDLPSSNIKHLLFTILFEQRDFRLLMLSIKIYDFLKWLFFKVQFFKFLQCYQHHNNLQALMGNSETQTNHANLKDFPMQKYLGQGLNQNQILQIKEAFDSYQPQNGQIDLTKIRAATEESRVKQKLQTFLKGKRTMNFDEFFAMSKNIWQEEMKRNPSMIIDTDEVEASCLFCPYSVDKKK